MSNSSQSLRELINPSAKQIDFLQAIDRYKYVLYGGAKGGGKSYILRWALIKLLVKWAMQGHKNVRVGLFCEDYPSLKDRQITKIAGEFPAWLGKLSDNNIEGMSFRLSPKYGGGVIALRNLDDPAKYASSEFAAVAIDELTKNEKNVFDQMRSIIRWPGINETRFLGATNPGEIGHAWVKKLWIEREFGAEDPKPEEVHFVKSLPTDNPYLAASYLDELRHLPEDLRKAYWEGSWDIFSGQYFREWRAERHVVEPRPLCDTFKRFRTIDFGRTAPFACLWGEVDFDGNLTIYREYYGVGKDADENTRAVLELSKDDPINPTTGRQYELNVIDRAVFSKQGMDMTIADIIQANGLGPLQASGGKQQISRVAGWNILHEYLRWDETTRPRLTVFSTCVNTIRTIPQLIHDDLHPEDVNTDGEDHIADATRYLLVVLHEHKTPPPMAEIDRRLAQLKMGAQPVYNPNRFYSTEEI